MTWVTVLKIGDNPDGLAAMRDLADRQGGLTDPNDRHKPSPVVKELYDLYGALPMIRDFATVPRMVDELLEANREYLPQFFG